MAACQDVLSLERLHLQRVKLYRYRVLVMSEIVLAGKAGDRTRLNTLGYLWHRTSNHIRVLDRWIERDTTA